MRHVGMDSVVRDAILEPLDTRTVTRRVTHPVANKDACSVLYPDCALSLSLSLSLSLPVARSLSVRARKHKQFYAFGIRLEDISLRGAWLHGRFTTYKSRVR